MIKADLTLETLAKRVEALEAALAAGEPSQFSKDWRKALGVFAGSEFMKQVDEERRTHRQVMAYRELVRLFDYFRLFQIVGFDELCADQFEKLRAAKVRIGTMDLKIAATALVHSAILLPANLRDFKRVPGLRVENWLECAGGTGPGFASFGSSAEQDISSPPARRAP